ncbi:MAG: 4-hydroxy-tetrahydrodipicolinate synthase [Candidatus Cloacimonetes bacterium]|nr:4-hydroxy-tetrahydrodipicolinate synthase [Candidatus Cloacimonadota bacterium]
MFEGLYTAIVTPFNEKGELDRDALERHIRFQAENGVRGIVPCGTTGENPTLTPQEHLRVFDITIQEAKRHNLQVIAGCGSNDTRKAIDLCKEASVRGADAALVITPYYNKPNQEGLYQHFMSVADESDIPVMLYNVPSRTNVNLLPETVERLSYHENIVALKDASGSLSQVQDVIFRVNERLAVFSGEDDLTYAIMAVGGRGVVSVTSNVVPRTMADLVEAMLDNKFLVGQELSRKLNKICNAMFIDTNPIPVKAALNMIGHTVGATRLPLTELSETNSEILRDVLCHYQLLNIKSKQRNRLFSK